MHWLPNCSPKSGTQSSKFVLMFCQARTLQRPLWPRGASHIAAWTVHSKFSSWSKRDIYKAQAQNCNMGAVGSVTHAYRWNKNNVFWDKENMGGVNRCAVTHFSATTFFRRFRHEQRFVAVETIPTHQRSCWLGVLTSDLYTLWKVFVEYARVCDSARRRIHAQDSRDGCVAKIFCMQGFHTCALVDT